jgi:hypothetical protein
MKKLNILLITVILCVLLLVVTTVGCQQQPEPAPTLSPVPNPLPPASSDKGTPKLDSQLNQLVDAESRGEVTSFAEQSRIELVDGAVRVIIECIPGELEAATEAATNVGAKVETSYRNLLQVVVPITSLTTLADAESIHFIRSPQYPLPGAKGEVDAGPN